MGFIKMTSRELRVLKFNDSATETTRQTLDDANVTICSSVGDREGQLPYPTLSFFIGSEKSYGGAVKVIFEIDSVEDIDLLRRYCEMTLELFRDASLN